MLGFAETEGEERRGSRSDRFRVMLALTRWNKRIWAGVARFAGERNWILEKAESGAWETDLADWRGDGLIVEPDAWEKSHPIFALIKYARVPTVSLCEDNPFLGSGRVFLDQGSFGNRVSERTREHERDRLAELSPDDDCSFRQSVGIENVEMTLGTAFEHQGYLAAEMLHSLMKGDEPLTRQLWVKPGRTSLDRSSRSPESTV